MGITAVPATEATTNDIRQSNFDLIRLLAAFQVMTMHAVELFGVTALRPSTNILKFFPGVPIFFMVSGFLVSHAWARAESVPQYALNRALRIFPALWACVAVSIFIALACGARPSSTGEVVSWLSAQVTVFQFYNADFLRMLPTGGLNGSLWTIPVELQFYVLLPVLTLFARDRWNAWVWYGVVTAAAMMIAQPRISAPVTMGAKLLGVSVLPYLFYFIVGVVALRIFRRAPWVFRGKLLHWAMFYLAWIAVERSANLTGWGGNQLSVPTALLLGGLTVATAFTVPSLAGALLRAQDVSYGIYLYHVPLINLILVMRLTGGLAYVALIVSASIFAFLSWRLIERPALRLKRYSSRQPAGPLIETAVRLAATG